MTNVIGKTIILAWGLIAIPLAVAVNQPVVTALHLYLLLCLVIIEQWRANSLQDLLEESMSLNREVYGIKMQVYAMKKPRKVRRDY